jgi:hypothetical protein
VATRPLIDKSIDELQRLLVAGRRDRTTLQQLAAELSHRSTKAARALKAEVDRQLTELASPPPAADTTPVLCLDFGTSSLRAAWRVTPNAAPSALSIGGASQSQIDEASIPSAIFVSADGSMIHLGQTALDKGLRGEPNLLFETSPKRWIANGRWDELLAEACPGIAVTRRELVAGLVAYALSAACDAAGFPVDALEFMDVRVAHPVWPSPHKAEADHHLAWMLAVARGIAGRADMGIAPAALADLCRATRPTPVRPTIDVVEPIAAALELFADTADARECCAVIDVGAGTIDLGLLISLTPDHAARAAKRKLIPLCDPKSIYGAGDVVDDELVDLIQSHSSTALRPGQIADLQRRKRSLKEQLFRNKRLAQFGAHVTLDDLEQRPRIRQMAQNLKEEFLGLVRAAETRIDLYASYWQHPINQVSVVFAGGGADIGFLRAAVPSSVPIGAGRSLPVKTQAAGAIGGGAQLPASLTRLAVALGGTASVREWPISEMRTPVRRMPGLSGIPRS